jgi:hypothetical protein
MKKFAILAVVVAVLLASSALAWGGYIFEDPIFGIGDNVVNVLIGKDVPAGETVSRITHVHMYVPRNVPSRLIDPLGCQVRLSKIAPQYGPLRISLAAVLVPRTDQGSSYRVQVTVFDDAGYSLTLPGWAGRITVVPYIQWQ